MKSHKKLFATLFVILCGFGFAQAQHFNDYFVDKTLRINYLHIGNKDVEKLQIDHFTMVNHWNGTRSQLVEPYHYGDILIEVLDQASQKLIFSRSYSCLFTEYRTTERGETEIASMEECVVCFFFLSKLQNSVYHMGRGNNCNIGWDRF